ncbi:decapping nuclease DXO homolog, chloroplastic-like [Actinia tenebrosa]|uniref:Decapping nuclease n=1 Tax=Actinia tenebrosa TaxID=6105 RepID=A0A6P8JFP9_ACTTE|nr:decapping nuclease DXO homolog, chloroplastic-like [Actinia tenebrosa]
MAAGNHDQKYFVKRPESYVQNKLKNDFSWSDPRGSYSIDAQGNFYNNDERELRSLIPNYNSKYGSDLTAGFDPSEKDGRPLDSLLYWIVLNKNTISKTSSGPGKRLDAEFVFTVGAMRRLLATLFDTDGNYKQPWKMYAIKYNGTIYISSVKDFTETVGPPQEPKLGCQNRDEELKMISFMGLKFEELISKLEPGKSQGKPADRKVDGRQGFYSVRRGKFGGRHLVLTRAQVDFAENDEYVECKLCPDFYTGQDEWKFSMYKLRNWWYHMYAANMKQVIYGIRDGPKLKQVCRIRQSEIPRQVKNPNLSCPLVIQSALRSWNPMASIGFVDDFLQWLKGIVVEDSHGMDGGRAVQYVLEWGIRSSFIGYSREEVRMSNFVLLPDWYITEMSAFFG